MRNAIARVACTALAVTLAGTATSGEIDSNIRAALAADIRSEAEVAHDANRKPLATAFGNEHTKQATGANT